MRPINLTRFPRIKWAIRSGVSKVVTADHDTLSETAEVLVNYEGLAILSLLKVQSVPTGNFGGAAHMNKNLT
jgi:hypothetical protein